MIKMTKSYALRVPLALLALGTLFSTGASAQAPPVLPELTFKRLLNDLQVVVASTPAMGESMTIGLVLRYGSAFDPAEKGGLANLISRMFGKTTLDRSAEDIQNDLEYLGATLEVRCDWDSIQFILRGQSSKYERSLLLLYQIVGEAQFNEDDFAKVKAELLQEIGKTEDPRQRIRTQMLVELFRGTTYGRNPVGSKASLQNISMGDVRYFYRRFFSSGSASLVVAGSTPAAQVIQKATRIWGVWVRKEDVPFTFVPPREVGAKNIFLEDEPSSPAAQFVLGNLWPRRDDPSYYPVILAARIVQERLTKELPTSLLTVGFEGRRMNGPFYIQGQAAADQAIAEIQKIIDIVGSVQNSGVSAEELAEAQNHWIGQFNQSLASTEGICRSILDAELYRLGTNYATSFPDLIRRNRQDVIKEVAKEWLFPGGVDIFVRGPAATLKPSLESLGSLKMIPR
jgi:zinc protease